MWQRFAEHLPTVAAACVLASLIGSARAANKWRTARVRRSWLELCFAMACCGLLDGAGGVLASAVLVKYLDPWPAVAVAASLGVAWSLSTERGLRKFAGMSLRVAMAAGQSLQRQIGSDSRSRESSEQD